VRIGFGAAGRFDTEVFEAFGGVDFCAAIVDAFAGGFLSRA